MSCEQVPSPPFNCWTTCIANPLREAPPSGKGNSWLKTISKRKVKMNARSLTNKYKFQSVDNRTRENQLGRLKSRTKLSSTTATGYEGKSCWRIYSYDSCRADILESQGVNWHDEQFVAGKVSHMYCTRERLEIKVSNEALHGGTGSGALDLTIHLIAPFGNHVMKNKRLCFIARFEFFVVTW